MHLNTLAQLLRFAFVGVASNAVLYFLYLFATSLGVEHKLAMSGLYLLGVLQTFVLNKSWSFRHSGRTTSTLLRYFVVYLLAYVVNLGVMIVLVDLRGYSDRIVQGAMIIVVAMLLFFAQKYWVFRPDLNPSGREGA